MLITRQLFRAAPFAVAILAAACNGTPGSTGNPASPSSSGSQGSQSSSGLTPAQSTAVAAACGLQHGDDGTITATVGTPPPDGSPHTVQGPDPNPPSGPPPAGAQVMFGGSIDGVSGSCPSLSLSIHGTRVQTNSATTFGSGASCSSLKAGTAAAAFGTIQANGSLLASCVAGI
jgi:uncharacterized protein DUF5666